MKQPKEVEALRAAYLDLWKNRLPYRASFVVVWKGNRVYFITNIRWRSNMPIILGKPAPLGTFWFPERHPGTRLPWLGKHVYHVHNWKELKLMQ